MTDAKASFDNYMPSNTFRNATFSIEDSSVYYIDDSSGSTQIHRLDINTNDRTQITYCNSPIKQFVYAPHQQQLIYSTDNNGDEFYQLYLLNTETDQLTQLTTNPNARFNAGTWSSDGNYFSYSSNERNGTDFDVYVLNIASGVTKRVYEGGGWCSAAGFSPRGTFLAVFSIRANDDSDIYLCNLDTGVVEHVNPHEENVQNGPLRWSHDESFFYFTCDQGSEFKSLVRYTLETMSNTTALDLGWDIDRTAISADGQWLAIVENNNGFHKLLFFDFNTLNQHPFEFSTGEITSLSFSRNTSRIIITHNSSTIPSELSVIDPMNKSKTTLATADTNCAGLALVEPSLAHITSFDGRSVPTFIYQPAKKAHSPPTQLLIYIHGGPEAQYRPAYNAMAQYFAGSGYIVVAPNIRGSSGYGKTYLSMDNLERRPDALNDVHSVRQYFANQYGNTAQFFLMGASYGGYVVLSCLAQTPDLWAAGINLMGIVNFETFLENTAPYRRKLREAEYGSLKYHRDLLRALSPIHFANRITCPLFVAHGARDVQVPITETFQLITLLKQSEQWIEFKVYDNEGHGFQRLETRIDVYARITAFIERAKQRELQQAL